MTSSLNTSIGVRMYELRNEKIQNIIFAKKL